MLKFIQRGNKVNINGKEFDLELFLALEPEYVPAEENWVRLYQPEKKNCLTNGRTKKNFPLDWKDGDRYLTRVSDLIYLKAYLASES